MLLQSPERLPQPTGSQAWRGCGERASGFVRRPVCWLGRTSPDSPHPQAILPQPSGAGAPRDCCLAREGPTVPEDRHWLPPKAQGRKRWTKKRQSDGRGAKGKETQLGKEPKGAGGLGAGQREGGTGGHCQLGEEAQQPEGREGSPGASLPCSDGAGAARLPRRRGLKSGRLPGGQRLPG